MINQPATPIQAPNGSTLEYHQVHSTLVDPVTGILEIEVGSWPDAATSKKHTPASKITLKVKYPSWRPEYFDQLDQTVSTHPEWTKLGPTKPSEDCIYDALSKIWINPNPIEVLKAAAYEQVEKTRDALILQATVEYNGDLLDADPVSQRNIVGKIGELEDCLATETDVPVEFLMWRLADNSDKFFGDAASYLSWLRGLRIVITRRGTQAYAWSWQKKAEIAAAQTYEELQAISLTD